MQTEVMKLEDINPAPYNPRVELQPGDAQYEALKNSLGRFGLVEPLVVNRKTGNLISGHQRLNVLKAQGIEEAEVIVADLDEEAEKAANIAMNKIEGEWDYDKLDEIFEGMDREELKFTGFEPGEVASMYEEALEEEAETPKQGGGGNGGGEGNKRRRTSVQDLHEFSEQGEGAGVAEPEGDSKGVREDTGGCRENER